MQLCKDPVGRDVYTRGLPKQSAGRLAIRWGIREQSLKGQPSSWSIPRETEAETRARASSQASWEGKSRES